MTYFQVETICSGLVFVKFAWLNMSPKDIFLICYYPMKTFRLAASIYVLWVFSIFFYDCNLVCFHSFSFSIWLQVILGFYCYHVLEGSLPNLYAALPTFSSFHFKFIINWSIFLEYTHQGFSCSSIGRVNPELYALSAGTWGGLYPNSPNCKYCSHSETWMQNYANVLCINCWQVVLFLFLYVACIY